jgi:hypothetical protein
MLLATRGACHTTVILCGPKDSPNAGEYPLLTQVKKSIRSHLRHLPGEGRVVVDAYRHFMLLKRLARSKMLALRGEGSPDPETVYWIDPARIVWHTNYLRWGTSIPPEDRGFDPQRDRGRVYGGDWDIPEVRFDDLDIVRAIYDRVHSGAAWYGSRFHSNMLARLRQSGRAPRGIGSAQDLEDRYRCLDTAIASIREHGYRLSHEVELPGENKGLDGHHRFGAEISVNIDRHGRYLFQDGRHRLAIARALGVARVPVKVLVRHRKWVEFREFVRSLAEGGGGSSRAHELYQNPVHPDLQDFPSTHACEDRFTAIHEALLPGTGALLDVGANLAYFCHRFESLGYECYAVERFPWIALAADRIRIAEGRHFTVISEDLFSAVMKPPLVDRHFRVVLALNLFHHFLKRQEVFEKFKEWLPRLDVDTMFFEPHCPEERQMVGAHVNFGPEEFVGFILKHSCLREAQLIARCADGRLLYRLTR